MSWAQKRLDALIELAKRARASGERDAGLGELVQKVVEVLGADRGTLYLIEPATGELCSHIVLGDSTLDIRLKVGQGLAGWVAMAGIPLRINDVLKDDRFDARWDKASGYRTETVLAVPLLDASKRVLGVLQILNKRGGFDDYDLAFLEAVAGIFGLVEENLTLRGNA
ncbi:MAG: GAF domain-containing protein [Alphaproteobacteria bacterium]|nr:GAF domain-containing protein [Alphaproteobacteria bacterium]